MSLGRFDQPVDRRRIHDVEPVEAPHGIGVDGSCAECDGPQDRAESDGEFLARVGTDGEKWANEYLGRVGWRIAADTSPGTDFHDTTRGWFANAIEAGRSAGHGDFQALRSVIVKLVNAGADIALYVPEGGGTLSLRDIASSIDLTDDERVAVMTALEP